MTWIAPPASKMPQVTQLVWGRAGNQLPISPHFQLAPPLLDRPSLTKLLVENAFTCWAGVDFKNHILLQFFLPSSPTQWAMLSWTKAKTCWRICLSRKITLFSPSTRVSRRDVKSSLFAFNWNFFFLDKKSWHFFYCNCEHPSFNFRRGKKWWFLCFLKKKTKGITEVAVALWYCASVRNTEYTEILLLDIFRKKQYMQKPPLQYLSEVEKSERVESFLASPNRQLNPKCAEHLEIPVTAAQVESSSLFPKALAIVCSL